MAQAGGGGKEAGDSFLMMRYNGFREGRMQEEGIQRRKCRAVFSSFNRRENFLGKEMDSKPEVSFVELVNRVCNRLPGYPV